MNSIILFSSILIVMFAIQAHAQENSEAYESATARSRPTLRRTRSSNNLDDIRRENDVRRKNRESIILTESADQLNSAPYGNVMGVQQSTNLQDGLYYSDDNVAAHNRKNRDSSRRTRNKSSSQSLRRKRKNVRSRGIRGASTHGHQTFNTENHSYDNDVYDVFEPLPQQTTGQVIFSGSPYTVTESGPSCGINHFTGQQVSCIAHTPVAVLHSVVPAPLYVNAPLGNQQTIAAY